MFPRRGSRPAWRGTFLVSGHFRRPDLRCVCCRCAGLDIRSSTQSTCVSNKGYAQTTDHMEKCDENRIREGDVRGEGKSYFVYSRKPSSVSTRGSDSPERTTLRGSPRSGAVYCGESSLHQHHVRERFNTPTGMRPTSRRRPPLIRGSAHPSEMSTSFQVSGGAEGPSFADRITCGVPSLLTVEAARAL